MNGLVREAYVLLGCTKGSPDAMPIIRASHVEHIMNRLGSDPRSRNGPLCIAHLYPWNFRKSVVPASCLP